MAFYDLSKQEREDLVKDIASAILKDVKVGTSKRTMHFFQHEDTYIRKSAYLSTGKIYFTHKELQQAIIELLDILLQRDDFKIRQTVINAAGEIGKKDFTVVQHIFDTGLFDKHHSPRNAVIGSVKKMGEVNPVPVLKWAKKYLYHEDKEIRREICHGIELRGRQHPEDILPLLKELQFDKTKRVYSTLVHVLGQIAYKKDCLPKVIAHLATWKNDKLVKEVIKEIIDVHHRYRNFAALSQAQAKQFIATHYL
jgi:hypothetical protein